MGWWKMATEPEQDLFMGDSPLDIVGDMLDDMSQSYKESIGRNPKLAEVLRAIEICLGAAAAEYLSDCDELEIVALKAQTRKRKRRQAYTVGDFFAIDLREKLYGFGRVLGEDSDFGILVAIFAVTNKRHLQPTELKGKPLLFPPVFCGNYSLEEWRWKVIGGMRLEPGEYPVAKFKLGGLVPGEGWRIWQNHRERPATSEEIEGLEELAVWSAEGLEKRVRQTLGLE